MSDRIEELAEKFYTLRYEGESTAYVKTKAYIREALRELAAEKDKEIAELKRSPRIYTRCPACMHDTLVINDDKHLLCTWHKCPNPTIIDNAFALLDEVKRVLTIAQPEVCYMCCHKKPRDGSPWVHEEECESVRQLLTRLGGASND